MYQIWMLALCYMIWAGVHMQREFWAMSKDVIIEDNPQLPTTFFGWINTSLYLPYAMFQFGAGVMGDSFKKRYVLSISFTI